MNPHTNGWLERLSDVHGRMVFATAYRILGCVEDAEDVLQDVFLRVVKESPLPDSVKNWGAWLRVAAANRSVDLLRRRHAAPPHSEAVLERIAAPPSHNPRRIAEDRENEDILLRAIAQLPERDTLVFSLRSFDEMSYEEIGRELNLPVDLVGVILHRTRKRLLEVVEALLATPHERNSSHVCKRA